MLVRLDDVTGTPGILYKQAILNSSLDYIYYFSLKFVCNNIFVSFTILLFFCSWSLTEVAHKILYILYYCARVNIIKKHNTINLKLPSIFYERQSMVKICSLLFIHTVLTSHCFTRVWLSIGKLLYTIRSIKSYINL